MYRMHIAALRFMSMFFCRHRGSSHVTPLNSKEGHAPVSYVLSLTYETWSQLLFFLCY